MKKTIHKNYYSLKTQLQDVINNFTSSGTLIGDGDRNKIKIYKIGNDTINIKSFKVPNFINKVVYRFFRKSKAQRSYEYANILTEKKIGTPQPIAYFENTTLFGLQESYYVCKHLNYDLTYRELVTDPDYPDHENILRQFTKFTWQLHEKGVYFKDHSPGNTLIVKNGDAYDFFLVDLNRMSFFELDLEARMRNFSRLTPKKEMIKTMSAEYAKLSNNDFENIYEKMWFYTNQFQEKYHRKKRFKQKYLGKK
ncbi:MAG TPA: Kdo domain containing protein [Flavobacteriaceae bacterium]|nr:Kdo domain containing protein [Flavobacteriaceae bacterium]HBS11050.1 Kdo domain containing protein [Flavobacteriaceae bacterium]